MFSQQNKAETVSPTTTGPLLPISLPTIVHHVQLHLQIKLQQHPQQP